jgi:isocitrate lyase
MTRAWASPRWKGVTRLYQPKDVERLRGTVRIAHTLAEMGARNLWRLLNEEAYVPALGAVSGHQAVEMVQAGLKAIYVSGWQVAGDANDAAQTYPDQSLYPSDSVPNLVRRINNAFRREDEKQKASGKKRRQWFAPMVADAEAGFGGALNAFELMKAMIEAGAAGVHFEDQLASVKKCGHMGGKVLVPTREFIQKLTAARLASDVMGVPTVLIARTDSRGASLITSDIDPADRHFITGERTPEGFFRIRGSIDTAISRALSYAPYSDVLWFETSEPSLPEARKFSESVHKKFPGKLLAYNCSPSFNWKLKLGAAAIARFQKDLGRMGYKFQFVTLAGFHAVNHSMFQLAADYQKRGMAAYAAFQQGEFAAEKHGYSASRHQEFVGTEYFDQVSTVISGGTSSTLAMEGSTEQEQFRDVILGKGRPKR